MVEHQLVQIFLAITYASSIHATKLKFLPQMQKSMHGESFKVYRMKILLLELKIFMSI